MLKIKKLSKVMLVVFIMAIVLTVFSSASNYLVYDTGDGMLSTGINHAYDKSWTTTDYFDNGRGMMTYGFNNIWFNEDHCKSLHTIQTHKSWVGNDKHAFQSSNEAAPGDWTSTVSMGHGTKPVWEADYY